MHLWVIDFFDAVFMATKLLTRANLVISPQFLFTGGAVDGQHSEDVVQIFWRVRLNSSGGLNLTHLIFKLPGSILQKKIHGECIL
jgi:hypothetical protein